MSLTRRKYGLKQKWHSICSQHAVHDQECDLCDLGRWHYIIGSRISRFFYHRAYRIWYWWYNRPRKKHRMLAEFQSLKQKKIGEKS